MRSFVKSESNVAVAEPAQQTQPTNLTAISTGGLQSATAPVQAVVVSSPKGAVATRPAPSPYFDGELSESDIKKPFLAVVHNTGKRSAKWAPGTITIGEEVLSKAPADPNQPTPKIRVLFAKVSKVYQQNLKYDPAPTAPRPLTVRTEAEVVAAGGTLTWKTINGERIAPTWVPRINGILLVRSPEGVDIPTFSIIDGDKTYAAALTSFQKTSYKAGQTIMTDMSFSLGWDCTKTFYDLYFQKEAKGGNIVWCANLVRVRDEVPSDSLREIAKKLGGTQIEVLEDDETTV